MQLIEMFLLFPPFFTPLNTGMDLDALDHIKCWTLILLLSIREHLMSFIYSVNRINKFSPHIVVKSKKNKFSKFIINFFEFQGISLARRYGSRSDKIFFVQRRNPHGGSSITSAIAHASRVKI